MLLSQTGGLGSAPVWTPEFFDTIPMLREVWAEDPMWAENPGDGNPVTVVRDNGSIAGHLSPGASPSPVTVDADGMNGKPMLDFPRNAGQQLVSSENTNVDPVFTIAVLVRVREPLNASAYFTDSAEINATTGRALLGLLASNWRYYNTANANTSFGAYDYEPHLTMMVVRSGSIDGYRDGALTVSDAGATGSTRGLVLGSTRTDASSARLSGGISYVCLFDGDLTAHPDYGRWLSSLLDYYGIGA